MAKKLGLFKNTILSITALIIMNGVQQLLIYPYLTKQMGTAAFGNVLVVLGIIAIVAPATGQAVNNTRIVAQKKYDCSNGDANVSLLLLLIPGIAVSACFLNNYFSSTISLLFAIVLLIFTALKNYSDVEYRLNLNYVNYFWYYCAISLGYVVGTAAYSLFHSWILTLLIGEISGFAFVAVTGSIYRNPFKRSANFTRFLKDSILLYASYLLYNGVLNLDRVLLKYMVDSETVTIFYVSSLMGKMIALLVGPLNSIAISYLCKREKSMDIKFFGILVGGAVGVGFIFYLGTCIVTPVFAYLAYFEIYKPVVQFAPIANLSQIICFSGSFLLTVVLTMTSNRWQIIIQSIYAILFLVLSVTLCYLNGFTGFLWGLVLANTVRFILTVTVGFHAVMKVRKGKLLR